jgi:hypothetical protein
MKELVLTESQKHTPVNCQSKRQPFSPCIGKSQISTPSNMSNPHVKLNQNGVGCRDQKSRKAVKDFQPWIDEVSELLKTKQLSESF